MSIIIASVIWTSIVWILVCIFLCLHYEKSIKNNNIEHIRELTKRTDNERAYCQGIFHLLEIIFKDAIDLNHRLEIVNDKLEIHVMFGSEKTYKEFEKELSQLASGGRIKISIEL